MVESTISYRYPYRDGIQQLGNDLGPKNLDGGGNKLVTMSIVESYNRFEMVARGGDGKFPMGRSVEAEMKNKTQIFKGLYLFIRGVANLPHSRGPGSSEN